MNIRIKIIQFLISINEKVIFYPKLKNFYKKRIDNGSSNMITILDVGSNKGQSIDFFSKVYQNVTIYAFEPNPILYKKIKNKYRNRKNIFIYNLGVSDMNGQLELNETVTDETSTFEQLNYDSIYLQMKANVLGVKKEEIIKNKYFVNVICLSDFIINNKINKIDIIKIDTEGHELKCLKGLFKYEKFNINYIQLESHNDDMYLINSSKEDIPNLLKTNGFTKCTNIKHGFGDFYECIYEN